MRSKLPLLLIVAIACGHALAVADERTASNRVLTIEEAIDVAKRCIIDGNIRVVGSFIESARLERQSAGDGLERQSAGDRGPFWQVTWAPSREIKGGQVFVAVFDDRTCRVTYGE